MTTNTLAKLAACPFCAGAARRSNGGEGKRAYFGAGCNTHKCPAELHALFYKSQDAADEAWNRRALTAQALPAAGRCDECGKDQAEGWALYCVDCMEKTGLLAKEALPNAQHVSSTAADLTGPNDTAAATTAAATTAAATTGGGVTTGAPSEPFGYFKAQPFGWTDCAEDDDGAVALYEGPQQAAQAPALTDHEIETLAHRMCWRYKHDGDSYGDPAYTFNKATLIDFVRRVGAGSVSGWPSLLAGAALQQSVATMESAAAHLESLPKMHQGKLLAHDLRRAVSCCETALAALSQSAQPQSAQPEVTK